MRGIEDDTKQCVLLVHVIVDPDIQHELMSSSEDGIQIS
jgi:hypothetical protein